MVLRPRCSGTTSVVLLVCWVRAVQAFTLVEFLVGPKIGTTDGGGGSVSPKSVPISPAQELVNGYGYPFEEHEAVSEDGYILSLHRIPRSKSTDKIRKLRRPVALFQHGLLASSDAFLFKGPEHDLPYLLADAGYDVWLANMRGNFYSSKHQTLDATKDSEYWRFSLHEVGFYDLPAMIDYILNKTKENSLYYLGHSVGSSAALILGSLRPEYNSKIKLHIALAPLVYVLHDISLPHKLVQQTWTSLQNTIISDDILNVFPRRKYFSQFLDAMCSDGMPTQILCLLMTFSFVGVDVEQFNTTYIHNLVSYYPAGASVYLISHAAQIYFEGKFRSLDYQDQSINFRKYNSIPPVYNLSLVNHPVSLHYGEGDYLVTAEDIKYTNLQLPNSVGIFKVPFRSFNHIDFMVGSKAKELLYKELVLLMNKYK
ncbi:lipase 3-like [Sitophilus oryzae]|uniref:Lipase n=1 Tax=Sitophilus oryzae TaxID=7048 RepID=A0A6J2YCX3_SITOR|nr:lipase 3-like [Sitophilus oryzae]